MSESFFPPTKGGFQGYAKPNFDYLLEKHQGVSSKNKARYAEYREACESAGETPCDWGEFQERWNKWLKARRRARSKAASSPLSPGDFLICQWAILPRCQQRDESGDMRRLFLAVMPYSDYSFATVTYKRSPLNWMRCCAKAYRFFGCVPRATMCIHLTESERVVNESDHCARTTLQAFAAHYKTALFHPRCRKSNPSVKELKPLTMKHLSKVGIFLRGELDGTPFMPIEELDECVTKLLSEFNNAIGARGISRCEDFEAHESPRMLPLPSDDYDMAVWCERKVYSDYHIRYKEVGYSVPYQYAHRIVRVRCTDDEIEAYSGGALIARHQIQKGVKNKMITDLSHRPREHRAFDNRLKERFMKYARKVGPATNVIMSELLSACEKGGGSYRPCKDLLDLRNLPSGITLEEACAIVLNEGLEKTAASVASVMGDLQNG